MAQTTRLVGIALLFAAGCGGSSSLGVPTVPTTGYSIQVTGSQAGQFPSAGLLSPLSVSLIVRDDSGNTVPILGGTAALRDVTDAVFARAELSQGPADRASVELVWSTGEARGKAMDLVIRIAGASGATVTVFQSLPFPS
jgi:hypothetical protein